MNSTTQGGVQGLRMGRPWWHLEIIDRQASNKSTLEHTHQGLMKSSMRSSEELLLMSLLSRMLGSTMERAAKQRRMVLISTMKLWVRSQIFSLPCLYSNTSMMMKRCGEKRSRRKFAKVHTIWLTWLARRTEVLTQHLSSMKEAREVRIPCFRRDLKSKWQVQLMKKPLGSESCILIRLSRSLLKWIRQEKVP